MKTVPIEDVIFALANCTAVQVDGSELIYPELHDDEGDDRFMSLETQYGPVHFSLSKNPAVKLTSNGAIVLVNDNNEPVTIAFVDVNAEAIVASHERAKLADFIYATTGTDVDGSVLDFGYLRAKGLKEAIRLLATRYEEIGLEGEDRETKLCRVKPLAGPGIPENEPPVIIRP